MEAARTVHTQSKSEAAPAVVRSTEPPKMAASPVRTVPLYSGPPALRLSPPSGATQGSLPTTASQLVGSPGPGEGLQPQVQQALESSFGAGLGSVRVHSDTRTSAAAESLGARAFTYGPNIFLGSGESPSDLALMAHEGAHVVQQQGMPTLQAATNTPSTDVFEQEARRASSAVQRGEQVTVAGRTNGMHIQKEEQKKSWWERATGLVSAGKDWLLSKAAEWAKRIPGYDLLTVILGKDPISDKPVERNAINLLRGLLGLVPGGAAMFENLQQSGALQRAFEWFNQEITKLNLTWETIKGLFRQFWDSLSASDALNPSGVFDRIKQLFGPPLERLINFAKAAGGKIVELIFEGALSLAGSMGKRVLAIIQRAGAVFSLIVNDPIGFLKKLIQAVKGGFLKFSSNILTHLKNALFQWLFGALQGTGLILPDKFDFKGVISIILQVIGLTYARLREKLVKLIGEPAVAFIEKAFEFVKILVTQGIAAAWQKILEFATGLVDTVIEGIRNWAAKSIVGAAITKLVTMFNPVGAIIQGIITIYNTVMFFIERAQQIAALAQAVFDSIANIASGNLGAAIDYVEKTMARTLPVIIAFLARLIGLGGISDEIKKIIKKIQSVVENALNKVVSFIVDKAKALVAKVTGKGKPDERTEEQKQKDLDTAMAAAQKLLEDKKMTPKQIRKQLLTIKSKYKITVLEIVTDSKRNTEEIDHIHGEINPVADGSPIKRPGDQEQGAGSSRGSTVVPTDLHAFGNTTKPRDPRAGKDIDVDPDGNVGPTDPPTGASTFGDINEAPLTGPYHRLNKGTQLLEGIMVIADGSDVGGPHGRTHHTIFPGRRTPFTEFVSKFLNLGWRFVGKK